MMEFIKAWFFPMLLVAAFSPILIIFAAILIDKIMGWE